MFNDEINKWSNKIIRLEDKLLGAGVGFKRLGMLKLSYLSKHNYCEQDHELIAFISDYYSHLIELKRVYKVVE